MEKHDEHTYCRTGHAASDESGPAAAGDHGRRAGQLYLVRDAQDADARAKDRRPPTHSAPREQFLSAGKKLLDTRHPAFKAVSGVRGRVLSYWKGISLPYPEPGIRLIRQDDIGGFNVQMTTLKAELEEAVSQLNEHYAELKSAARERLGRLFNSADYPESLDGLFAVDWDFPSVEPPEYLRQLSPELYRQESQRVAARFDEAVRLAEEAFTAELAKLVSHLTERLSGQEDGKAQDLPRFGGRELERFLPAVPRTERRLQRAARSIGQSSAEHRPGRRAAATCATRSRSASKWRRNFPASSRCSMA